MKTKPIYFIFCYARSGGTFFNRYLANFDEFIILSEAHPIHNSKGGIHSVKEQMKKWYGIEIKSENYIDQIDEAKKWCDENNKYLIIRDWSYIDFAKSYLNDFNPPKTSTNLKLLEERFEVKKIAYVRDAIDVCLSQGQNIKTFSEEYLDFVQYIKKQNLQIFKYEDFVENSQEEFELICKALDLPKFEKEAKNDVSSQKVIGDINVSRGNQSGKIVKLKRRYAGYFKRKAINTNKELIEANKLLDYPAYYESKKHEEFIKYLKFEIKVFPQNFKSYLHGKLRNLKRNLS